MLKEIFSEIIEMEDYDPSLGEIEKLEYLLKEYKNQNFKTEEKFDFSEYKDINKCCICNMPGTMYEFEGQEYDCSCLTDILIEKKILKLKRVVDFELIIREEYYFENELIETLDNNKYSQNQKIGNYWNVIDKILNKVNIKDLDENFS